MAAAAAAGVSLAGVSLVSAAAGMIAVAVTVVSTTASICWVCVRAFAATVDCGADEDEDDDEDDDDEDDDDDDEDEDGTAAGSTGSHVLVITTFLYLPSSHKLHAADAHDDADAVDQLVLVAH